jgi:hypothetical protein
MKKAPNISLFAPLPPDCGKINGTDAFATQAAQAYEVWNVDIFARHDLHEMPKQCASEVFCAIWRSDSDRARGARYGLHRAAT